MRRQTNMPKMPDRIDMTITVAATTPMSLVAQKARIAPSTPPAAAQIMTFGVSANCISRGVPDPTGVTGDTVFTVLMMLPNPVGFAGLKVDCG